MLAPDRTGSTAIHEVECMSCSAGCGPADDDDGPAVRALRHARDGDPTHRLPPGRIRNGIRAPRGMRAARSGHGSGHAKA
ncbi:DUF7848 domain-containing protein [Streptomyces sp. NBC_01207]|uniref:DUF7848 domain-containing protein n=1 Tax=Streptomyces sp. NBC_01207 TaxID=2903772 RepID=UPI003FA3A548